MAIWTLLIADIHAGSNYAVIPEHLLRRPMKRKECPKVWHERDKVRPGYIDLRLNIMNDAIKEAATFNRQFHKMLENMPKIDHCIILSDNIEGKQEKSHTPELITSDTTEQYEIAGFILDDILKAGGYPRTWGVRGTDYHVGDMDDIIYQDVPNIQGWDDSIFLEIGGLMWRAAHFVGRSGTPYGKQTPLSKNMIMNTLLASASREHSADVMVYGHVHYSVGASFPMSNKQAFTCPAMKRRGERYGMKFYDFYDVGLMLTKQEKEGSPIQYHPLSMPITKTLPRIYK